MKRIALTFSALILLGGCTIAHPMGPDIVEEDPEEVCELVTTLEVIRTGNVYITNELEIHRDRLGLDCRRVMIREEWMVIGGIAWLWTFETWECYDCPDEVI